MSNSTSLETASVVMASVASGAACASRAPNKMTRLCSSALGTDYSCVTGLTYDATVNERQGDGNCIAAVYKSKETVNSEHVIDCNMTQCSFTTGSANGECGEINCKCGSECSSMSKTLVEGSLSGKPAKIQVTESSQLTIVIEGSPLPLSATCKASACERAGGDDATQSSGTLSTASTEDATDTDGVGLAVVACVALAALLLLGCFSFCCCVAGVRSGQKEEDLETELLKVASRSAKKLEFRNISCFASVDKKSTEQNGSGKTTLLNALAAMQNGTSKFTGELLLDGSKVTKEYRRIAAYVQQDDSLFSTLTVRECIAYSAQLRLPTSMTASAKTAMVTRVIAELNLSHVASSRIGSVGGSTSERGISGGEDAVSSAHSVVKLIKELASHDRIVILSIHQPSSRSFLLLDKIMLLGKGQLLYNGKPADSKQYFHDLGFKCPEDDNVADFILDVAVTVTTQPEEFSPKTPVGSPAYEAESSPSFLATMIEIRVLFTRTAQNILRHRSLLIQHVVLSLVLALFGGLIFNNVSDNLAGFQNRMGAFYFILTFFGFASMSSMDLFISERPIFLRETGAMYYGAFSYFLAKMTLDSLLLRVLPASIFACIFYWIMALQASADRFLLFWLTLVLFNVAAGAICALVGVLSRRVGSANLAATVVLLIMLLFGGFLLNSETMPGSVGWLKHLSIFGYAFEILMANELEGIVLSFDAPGYPAVPVFGEVYLKTLGMDYTQRYYDVAALALIAIVLQFLAYVFLSLQVPKHRAMAHYGKNDGAGGKEEGYEACSSGRIRQ
ncbi:P-loop containing nucleoside triphosphate hydrolase [Phytophthora cactorum]|nr:P-loop containing nucleoside triphosphate hydrolase [Phytophthora cactorum]